MIDVEHFQILGTVLHEAILQCMFEVVIEPIRYRRSFLFTAFHQPLMATIPYHHSCASQL